MDGVGLGKGPGKGPPGSPPPLPLLGPVVVVGLPFR